MNVLFACCLSIAGPLIRPSAYCALCASLCLLFSSFFSLVCSLFIPSFTIRLNKFQQMLCEYIWIPYFVALQWAIHTIHTSKYIHKHAVDFTIKRIQIQRISWTQYKKKYSEKELTDLTSHKHTLIIPRVCVCVYVVQTITQPMRIESQYQQPSWKIVNDTNSSRSNSVQLTASVGIRECKAVSVCVLLLLVMCMHVFVSFCLYCSSIHKHYTSSVTVWTECACVSVCVCDVNACLWLSYGNVMVENLTAYIESRHWFIWQLRAHIIFKPKTYTHTHTILQSHAISIEESKQFNEIVKHCPNTNGMEHILCRIVFGPFVKWIQIYNKITMRWECLYGSYDWLRGCITFIYIYILMFHATRIGAFNLFRRSRSRFYFKTKKKIYFCHLTP